MAVEMRDDLFERVVAAVAEIGRGHGEVAQGGRVVGAGMILVGVLALFR